MEMNIRVGRIIRIRDVKSRIDDWDIVATTIVKLLQELLAFGITKTVWVVIEITVGLHVINVIPVTGLEWNSGEMSRAKLSYQRVSTGISNLSKLDKTESITDQFWYPQRHWW